MLKPGVPHSKMEIADRPKLANNIKTGGGTNMNNTQNQKIAQVTDKTLIVGADTGSENHYARAILARGFEVSKKPFPFTNTEEGFESFVSWIYNLAAAHKLTKIMYIQTMRPRIDTIARCTPRLIRGCSFSGRGCIV